MIFMIYLKDWVCYIFLLQFLWPPSHINNYRWFMILTLKTSPHVGELTNQFIRSTMNSIAQIKKKLIMATLLMIN